MCKGKKFRKVLNVFLCVIYLTVVFSVSAFAVEKVCGVTVCDVNGNLLVESCDDSSSEYLVLRFYDGYIQLESHANNGDLIEILSVVDVYYDYFICRETGKMFFSGEYFLIIDSADAEYYRLDAIVEGLPLEFVGSCVSAVFSVISDFAGFISENTLMLLFAIGLPVCSVGVGLLIRLKERT